MNDYEDQAYVELQIQEYDVTGENQRDWEWFEANRRCLEEFEDEDDLN